VHTPTIHEGRYREILRRAAINKKDLILPIFVKQTGVGGDQINAMPTIRRISLGEINQYSKIIIEAGISSIIIFGIPERRDRIGSYATNKDGIVQQCVRLIKHEFGDLLTIITDVCVCQYNLSGHCGIATDNSYNIDNDSSLNLLSKIAVSHAEAGADIVAPSSMMDGQVRSIRNTLNDHGFEDKKILAYSVKQLSSLYTPFRSATFYKTGNYDAIDKSSYQIGYENKRQVMREIETDINEGSNMVMIKPGMLCTDLIYMIKKEFDFPLVVQSVSGEYAMIKAAAKQGWINEEEWKINSFVSLKRAGADQIISYFVMDITKYLDS
jgi:porphobilinogen synthase